MPAPSLQTSGDDRDTPDHPRAVAFHQLRVASVREILEATAPKHEGMHYGDD